MVFRLILVVVFGGAVIIGIVVGRSQSPPTAAAGPAPTATALPVPLPDHIEIVPAPGNDPPATYRPATLTIHVGDHVTWTNLSGTTETATADNGAFDTGVLGQGESYTWTSSKPGKYIYGSYLSPNLRGEIDVSP
jgi:plastocyanin